jgi:protein SCO1/2
MRRGGTKHHVVAKLAAVALTLAGCAWPCAAGESGAPAFMHPLPPIEHTEAAPDALKDIGVAEHLGSKLPLDLTFTDDHGQTVTLGKYFSGKKPVILQLGYLGCPMLCSLVSQGTVDSLRKLSLTAGKDYEIVFVSIDPKEGYKLAADKKETYVQDYHRDGSRDGFHFLVGKQPEITKLAEAVGFKYKWVEDVQQYSHPAVVMVASPEGKLTRYLYGVKFDDQTMRLSLVEASDGKVGNTIDQIILTCFHYDGKQGKYAMVAVNMMRAGGALTVLVLGTVLVLAFRHNARQDAAAAATDTADTDTGTTDPKADDDDDDDSSSAQ